MPQVIALAIAGAGLYAGYRWLSRELARATEDARRMHEDMRRQTEIASKPRDLGPLEADPASGVYRPKRG